MATQSRGDGPAAEQAAAGPPPHVQVIQMVTGLWLSRAVYAAAQLGIADLIGDGASEVEHLATATGTHAPTLRRLLRMLASVGLFRSDERGRYALTPLGATLRSDAPGAARSSAITLGGPWWWSAWGEFEHSLKTGETGMQKAHGQGIFDYLSQHPEDASHFNATMIGIHGGEPAAVATAYDFSGIGTLVDVGGGTGNLLTTILEANPALNGVLFDLPHVATEAERSIAAAGLADRCRVESGSFFEAVPAGGNVYMLSHIIHDWDEETCVKILANCRRAMGSDGRLLIVESVLSPGDEPDFGKLLDLVMLVIPGGQERSEDEYRDLLAKAGFRLTRVVPTQSAVGVVEAVPV
jgi:hypothetical protein